MAIVTLAEAAKLVGKSKPTLIRAHNDGKLSMERNANNEWRVDTSELLRTYGQFAETQHERDEAKPPLHHKTADIAGLEAENATLKRQIATLETTVEMANETASDLRKRLDESEQERRDTANTLKGLLTTNKVDKKPPRALWPVVVGVLAAIAAASITVTIFLTTKQ